MLPHACTAGNPLPPRKPQIMPDTRDHSGTIHAMSMLCAYTSSYLNSEGAGQPQLLPDIKLVTRPASCSASKDILKLEVGTKC